MFSSEITVKQGILSLVSFTQQDILGMFAHEC